MGLVTGIFHPKPVEGQVLPGPSVHPDDVEHALEEFSDVPVFVEHNPELVVGSIQRTYLDTHGNMVCDMFINDETPLGKAVMADVRNGTFKGLSTGFNFWKDPHTGKVIHITPREISLVEKGLFPDTYIKAFGSDNESVTVVDEAIETLSRSKAGHNSKSATTMSSSVPVIPASVPATQVASATPTPAQLEAFERQKLEMEEKLNAAEAKVKKFEAAEAEKAKQELNARSAVAQQILHGTPEKPGVLADDDNAPLGVNPDDLKKAAAQLVVAGEMAPLLAVHALNDRSQFYGGKYKQEVETNKALQKNIEVKDARIAELEAANAKYEQTMSGGFTALYSQDQRSQKRGSSQMSDTAGTSAAVAAVASGTPSPVAQFDHVRNLLERCNSTPIEGIASYSAGGGVSYTNNPTSGSSEWADLVESASRNPAQLMISKPMQTNGF